MHVLIVSGGYLNLDFAKKYCETLSFDKVFAVDRGLEYTDILGYNPEWILGDFDTINPLILARYENKIEKGELDARIERFPAKKDASDTEIALSKAIEIGADCVTILGATGSRLDHVLANMNILKQAEQAKVVCYIVDETNRIQLLSDETRKSTVLKQEEQFGHYISLIPMSPCVEGVNLKGVGYPLQEATIYQGTSLTVSNCITEETAEISIEKGCIWLIESRDSYQ